MASTKTVRIFISSPGDVAEEREKARRVIEDLQRFYNDVRLEAVLWEDKPLAATAPFQVGIDDRLNADADASRDGSSFEKTVDGLVHLEQPIDIAVFIFWSRLGTPLGPQVRRPDGSEYRSGTEREFELMDAAFKKSGKKRPIILVYQRIDNEAFNNVFLKIPADHLDEFDEIVKQKRMADAFVREYFHDEEHRNVRAFHTYREPVSFAHRLRTHLRGAIDDLVGNDGAPTWTGEPFRGLEVFDIAHAQIFHGRDEETCDLLVRLREREKAGLAFVVIVGSSGSGKSSVARAGVAASLTANSYDVSVRHWRAVPFVPGHPSGDNLFIQWTRALADVVPELRHAAVPLEDIAAGLAKDPALTTSLSVGPAFDRAAKAAGGAVRVLVVLDQMEELWTDRRISPDDRERFLSAIEVLTRSGHIAVLATLRSDFYATAQQSPQFLRLKGELGQYDLPNPSVAAIRRMITKPAQMAGLRFARDEQKNQTLDEVILENAVRDPSCLPLLQYTLAELYEDRDKPARTLTFETYNKIGGVEGAIGKRAAETFAGLPEDARAALPEILSLLVSVHADGEQASVRRRAPLSDLQGTPGRKRLTEGLIQARFLTTDQQKDVPVAYLAHEALLRRWNDLADWVNTNREYLRLRARVEQSQQRWTEQARNSTLLLPLGLTLEEGRKLLDNARKLLSRETAEYIRCSIAHHERNEIRSQRRRHIVMTVMGILTSVAIGGGVVAWLKKQEADEQRKVAHANEIDAMAQRRTALENEADAKEQRRVAVANEALANEQRRRAQMSEAEAKMLAGENAKLAETEKKFRELAERKTEEALSLLYSTQLARAQDLIPVDFDLALSLLESEKECPPELRDISWKYLFREAFVQGTPPEAAKWWNDLVAMHGRPTTMTFLTVPDRLLIGYTDGTICLVDGDNFHVVGTMKDDDRPVSFLQVTADGKNFVTATSDGRVCVWNLANRTLRSSFRIENTDAIAGMAVSPNGKWIAVYQNLFLKNSNEVRAADQEKPTKHQGIAVWNVATGKLERSFPPSNVSSVAFSPDSLLLAAATHGELDEKKTGVISVEMYESPNWNAAGSHFFIGRSEPVQFLAFSPDSKTLAIDGGLSKTEQGAQGIVFLRSARIPDSKSPLPNPDESADRQVTYDHGQITTAIFTADGKTLVTGGKDGSVGLWDPETGQRRLLLRRSNHPIRAVAVSGDSAMFAVFDDASPPQCHVFQGPRSLAFVAERVMALRMVLRITRMKYDAGLLPERDAVAAAAASAWGEADLAYMLGNDALAKRRAVAAAELAQKYSTWYADTIQPRSFDDDRWRKALSLWAHASLAVARLSKSTPAFSPSRTQSASDTNESGLSNSDLIGLWWEGELKPVSARRGRPRVPWDNEQKAIFESCRSALEELSKIEQLRFDSGQVNVLGVGRVGYHLAVVTAMIALGEQKNDEAAKAIEKALQHVERTDTAIRVLLESGAVSPDRGFESRAEVAAFRFDIQQIRAAVNIGPVYRNLFELATLRPAGLGASFNDDDKEAVRRWAEFMSAAMSKLESMWKAEALDGETYYRMAYLNAASQANLSWFNGQREQALIRLQEAEKHASKLVEYWRAAYEFRGDRNLETGCRAIRMRMAAQWAHYDLQKLIKREGVR